MQIEEKIEELKLTLILDGNLDKLSSPELEQKISEISDNIKTLTFDFEKVNYISSAGLRILAKAQEQMDSIQGQFTLKNINDSVMSVLEITGFNNILTIE